MATLSKPSSGHFKGTAGSKASYNNLSQKKDSGGIINKKGLDTREHPTKYKQMSSKRIKALREKVDRRTITKTEYKHMEWQKRLTKRRNKAIKEFWKNERRLIKNNLPTTRNWNPHQRQKILAGRQPKYKGKTMSSHHTYSVTKYPHLADKRELIYPVTFYEHVYGWHGGNTKNSLPGIPIKYIKEF
ncbi:MAG: hypothetical protein J5525_10170 [Lachnospiraceae bacterium]|nr:hypothetical protein [Lachnospiraceae bacterium]